MVMKTLMSVTHVFTVRLDRSIYYLTMINVLEHCLLLLKSNTFLPLYDLQ